MSSQSFPSHLDGMKNLINFLYLRTRSGKNPHSMCLFRLFLSGRVLKSFCRCRLSTFFHLYILFCLRWRRAYSFSSCQFALFILRQKIYVFLGYGALVSLKRREREFFPSSAIFSCNFFFIRSFPRTFLLVFRLLVVITHRASVLKAIFKFYYERTNEKYKKLSWLSTVWHFCLEAVGWVWYPLNAISCLPN